MDTKILIIGAGPVGLTLSLTLAKFEIECTVIERNLTTTNHPKMDITNGRSMEIFRMLGVDEAINSAAVAPNICHDVSWIHRLSNQEIYRFKYPSPNEARKIYKQKNDGTGTTNPAVRISQIVVEPLLRDAAKKSPYINLRYGWAFAGLEQTNKEVVTTIRNSQTGEEEKIKSEYLAGCDGGNSYVRRELGIELTGDAKVRKRYSIHFISQDKETFEPFGPAWHYQSPVYGTLVSQDGIERYTLHSYLEDDEDPETVDPYTKVKNFVGKDFHFELLKAIHWDNNLLVADRYRDRRVLLAGDATHQYIPTGGYGMNTGVGDAFDLGWKLSAVIQEWGGDKLLDSVEEERRPIALRNREGSKRHAEARIAIGRIWPDNISESGPNGDKTRKSVAEQIIRVGNAENESLGIEIGYNYAGSSIIFKSKQDLMQDDPLTYTPTTSPGYRPPAIYLANGKSIFDLFGSGYTLLNFLPGNKETTAFESEAKQLDIPFLTVAIEDKHAKEIYGFNLVLIRPDQHIAWRGHKVPEDIQDILRIISGNERQHVFR